MRRAGARFGRTPAAPAAACLRALEVLPVGWIAVGAVQAVPLKVRATARFQPA